MLGVRRAIGGTSYICTRSTTILCVRKGDSCVMIGDGQVTQGSAVMKPNAVKIRTLSDGKVITGFAGATADALTLFERLGMKLDEHPGQLMRACVELAKAWRTDKYLRRLEATMIVSDKDCSLILTGNGDVIEPHDGVVGVGSGGHYAMAAARGLMSFPELSAKEVAERSMTIAADFCVYTNTEWTTKSLKIEEKTKAKD